LIIMLCTNCNQRPGTVHYVSIINGVKTEQYLCPECAKELNMGVFEPFSWGDMLGHMPSMEKLVCSVCGMTPSRFRSTGLLGCEHCYDDLHSVIDPVLMRVQKSLVHTGRTPVGFEAAKLPESSAPAKELTEKEKLQQQLKEAVDKEDFESAAKLRDQIKGME